MRIFLGMGDVAGQLKDYEKGFEALGHQVTTCVIDKNSFFRHLRYDFELPVLGRFVAKDQIKNSSLRFLAKATDRVLINIQKAFLSPYFISQHDVFIFICGGTSIFSTKEFPLLKKMGKQIVSILVGSEVRHLSAFGQKYGGDFSTWEREFHVADLNQKISTLRTAEKYSDSLWSVIDQSDLGLRPFHHFVIPVDLEKYQFAVSRRDVPIIVHAPSRSGAKGTHKIVETLDQLRADGVPFDFRFLQNMPNSEVLKNLTEADILIDEIYAHGPAKLGFEAMTSGCAVANRFLEGSFGYAHPPICAIDETNLYPQFKKLIEDKAYRIGLAEQGRAFVEAHQTPEKVCQRILDCLDQKEPLDYFPNFFLNKYELENGQKVSPKNRRVGKEMILEHGAFSLDDVKKGIEKGLIDPFSAAELESIKLWERTTG